MTSELKLAVASPGRVHSHGIALIGTKVDPRPATTSCMTVVRLDARVTAVVELMGLMSPRLRQVHNLVVEAVSVVEKQQIEVF